MSSRCIVEVHPTGKLTPSSKVEIVAVDPTQATLPQPPHVRHERELTVLRAELSELRGKVEKLESFLAQVAAETQPLQPPEPPPQRSRAPDRAPDWWPGNLPWPPTGTGATS